MRISRAAISRKGYRREFRQDLYSLFIRKMQDAPPQEVTIVGDDWEEPVVSECFWVFSTFFNELQRLN